MHDAWAPYDSYVDAQHQLCCAHALRELQAVADTAKPDADWCWATQAGDALVAMQKLVTDAITGGAGAVDPAALDQQIQRTRQSHQVDDAGGRGGQIGTPRVSPAGVCHSLDTS